MSSVISTYSQRSCVQKNLLGSHASLVALQRRWEPGKKELDIVNAGGHYQNYSPDCYF